MTSFRICLLSLCLLMGTACSHQAKKTETISTSTTTNKENKMSQFTQREFLIRALEMMEHAKSIQDITKENTEKFFEIKMEHDGKNVSYFFDSLPHNWLQGIEIYKEGDKEEHKALFSFSRPDAKTDHVKLDDICDMELYEFIYRAERKGFTRMGFSLEKDNLLVEVIPQYSVDTSYRGKNCVHMIVFTKLNFK